MQSLFSMSISVVNPNEAVSNSVLQEALYLIHELARMNRGVTTRFDSFTEPLFFMLHFHPQRRSILSQVEFVE